MLNWAEGMTHLAPLLNRNLHPLVSQTCLIGLWGKEGVQELYRAERERDGRQQASKYVLEIPGTYICWSLVRRFSCLFWTPKSLKKFSHNARSLPRIVWLIIIIVVYWDRLSSSSSASSSLASSSTEANHCPGRFLGVIGLDPSVSESNRLITCCDL